jgi:glutathione S-transferase
VVGEYLEERYPEPPLLPADAGARAAARLLVFRFDDFGDAYYALRRGEAGADADLAAELTALDALLAATPFLTGAEFGLADISYLPWLLRLRDLMGVALGPYPAIRGWIDTCAKRPSVAAEIETVASLVA